MKTFEVYAIADANGHARKLGEVMASDRAEAMQIAIKQFGYGVGDVYEKMEWKPI